MFEPPKNIERAIFEHVEKDLKPTFLTVQTKVAVSAILGGVVSMFICGQFGIGFTSFAEAFTHHIHAYMNPFVCALVCGASYAVFPVLLLRLFLCNPLQFKAIIYRQQTSVFAWYVGFGSLLAYFGHHGTNLLNLFGWVVAALCMTHILARSVNLLMPLWSFQESFAKLRA